MNAKEMFDLSGKTAIVTGGSIGLGAQMATGLAEVGANLVIAARNVDRCEALCIELCKLGVRAIAVACDVVNPEDCQQLIDKTVSEFGTVDILVNNAGYTWGASSLNYPMEKWEQIMDINVKAVFTLSVMAAKIMKEKKHGKIINITSVGGFGGTPQEIQNAVAYNVSKGAVNILTKELAVKWARYGINVNAIGPGYFPSHMSDALLEKNRQMIEPIIPFRRLGGDDDLKGSIVFLSSDASNYITGHIIMVDGGFLAMP